MSEHRAKPGRTTTTIRIDEELYGQLSMIAQVRGISVNTASIQAVEAYVAKGRKDPKVTAAVEARLRSFLQ